MNIKMRPEHPADATTIGQVTEAAFKLNPHSSGTERAIIDALRQAGALTLSLVATLNEEIVGHVAFSPVTIGGADQGWYGLGPVSVRPDLQNQGIGQALIREGLSRLTQSGANGCVVVGDPAYYQRFGFQNDPNLRYEGLPPEYFMRLSLAETIPSGAVAYHEGFSAS